MTSDQKREALREKIAAGEQRLAERNRLFEIAEEAGENVRAFAKQHPGATIAGAVAFGLLIGALTPKGRLLSKRAGALLASMAEIAIAQALAGMEKAGEAAQAGQDTLEDIGDGVAAAARTARREIGYRAGTAADNARSIGKRVSRKTGRTVRDIKGGISH